MNRLKKFWYEVTDWEDWKKAWFMWAYGPSYTKMKLVIEERDILAQRVRNIEKLWTDEVDTLTAERDRLRQLANTAGAQCDELHDKLVGLERERAEQEKFIEFRANTLDDLVAKLDAAEARLGRLWAEVVCALNELGVPQPGYPQPVANAVLILEAALAQNDAPRYPDEKFGPHQGRDGTL